MKKILPLLLLLSTLNPQLSTFAQGTAFTYQGRLSNAGSPANGSNDFTFAVFLVASGGSPSAGPIKVDDVVISNGLFTATVDFGSGVFTGAVQWLEIGVRPGDSGGDYAILSPRQPITPTPYAIHAASAAVATFANTAIWSGLNGVPPGFVDGVDNDTTYSAGLGLGLVGTTFSLNSLFTDGRYWTLFGNSGTSAGANFLGTTDNQPLEIRVNNQRALRLEPNTNGAPNVIAGSPRNAVGAGIVGATIAGGGATNYFGLSYTNSVLADFGVVGGGGQNAIAAFSTYATIAGGYLNDIGTNSDSSAIGGGGNNNIAANSLYATITGGINNDIGTRSDASAIGGGLNNNIAADSFYATIAGGGFNDIGTNSDYSAIGGGYDNNISADSFYATIAGGWLNDIGTNSDFSAIGGGYDNNIESGSTNSAIGGGWQNTIQTSGRSATIAGGEYNTIQSRSSSGFIGGGEANTIVSNSLHAAIGGGTSNVIWSFAGNSFVGGGYANVVKASESIIGGGVGNFLDVASAWNTISGGRSNIVSFGVGAGTIAGGSLNVLGSDSDFAAIGGGEYNAVGSPGLGGGPYCTIGGGYGNFISPNSQYDVIGGGRSNIVQTTCYYATIPGGLEAAAASYGQFTHASGGFDHVRGSAQASEYLLRTYSTNNSTFELFLDGFGQRMILPTNSVWTFLMHVSAISETGTEFGAYEVRGVVSTVGSTFLQMRDGAGASVSTAPPIYETPGAVTWQATPYVDVPSQQFRIAVNSAPGQVARWLARVQTTEIRR